MQIHITATAQNNLGELYAWHREYSQDYADRFHDEIVAHLLQILSDNPRIGHVYDNARGLYRLIYKRRYNVYYTIDDVALYILFIIDGRICSTRSLRTQTSIHLATTARASEPLQVTALMYR